MVAEIFFIYLESSPGVVTESSFSLSVYDGWRWTVAEEAKKRARVHTRFAIDKKLDYQFLNPFPPFLGGRLGTPSKRDYTDRD